MASATNSPGLQSSSKRLQSSSDKKMPLCGPSEKLPRRVRLCVACQTRGLEWFLSRAAPAKDKTILSADFDLIEGSSPPNLCGQGTNVLPIKLLLSVSSVRVLGRRLMSNASPYHCTVARSSQPLQVISFSIFSSACSGSALFAGPRTYT